MAFNWTCPHCDRAQTVVDDKIWSTWDKVEIKDHALGHVIVSSSVIGCANVDCRQLTVTVALVPAHEYTTATGLQRWRPVEPAITRVRLMPESQARPQPDFIPSALRNDYYEACRIRDLSPKASATLARRCLQGMIRNFCGITKPTLFKEIEALRAAIDDGTAPRDVTGESVDAIDNVRSIGNIGAHMESDIDLIVDVDPDEAQVLIELIESLFEDWYVAKNGRQSRFAKLKAIADAKAEAKSGNPSPTASSTPEVG
jgi:hypothetical protein